MKAARSVRAKWLMMALASLLVTAAADAQFSGPAVGSTPQSSEAPVPTSDPALLHASQGDVVIAPGDVITVRIFGSPDYSPPLRVPTDGSVQLPLIGLVPLSGLSVTKAEDAIAQRLVDAGMYLNPQVTIQVSENSAQFATVGGEMHAIVPIVGERRLLDVLAQAGSLPATASHTVTILRPGAAKPIIVDLGTDPAKSEQANIPILPRDTILISRAGVVYVVGAFKLQGAIPLNQNAPLTLMQATALSGGAGYEGRFNDLRIIRTVGTERKLVRVDIKKVFEGKNADPILAANDIVFLPTNALKAAVKNGGVNTIAGLGSLLVLALQTR